MGDSQVFTSKKNYLKRDPSSGSTNMAAPSVLAAWFNYSSSLPINHNLGYVPLVRVYYQPFNDGVIFPASGSRVAASGVGIPFNEIVCLFEVTTTQVIIYLESASAETGTRPVYYVIYKDIPV